MSGLRLRGPASLRERLALVTALVTAVLLAGLAVVFNLVLSRQLRSGAEDLLHTRAAATVATIDVAPDGRLSVRGSTEDQSIDRTTWIFQGRTALQRAPGDRQQQEQVDRLVGTGQRTSQSSEPEAVRYFALPVELGGRQVGTVVSSVGLDPYDRVERLALVASLALSLLVLGGAYLLTRTLVGRVLAPVTQMTDQAAHWSSSDLERRFGTGGRPVELQALAATLDGVLDRLSAVLRHEQQLSAELSHELRTPLSALIAEVELLASRPRSPDELAAGHQAILSAAERMRGVLESLLTAARASTADAPGRCQVAPAVRAAVASVRPPEGVVTVREHAGPLVAGVDGALLERALAPVLDNALRHCREQVLVETGNGPTGPWIRVQDDGPGVRGDLVETAFEPGVSGADGHGGAGLGLALARRLARAGGGDLDLEPGTGGARFLLSLPTA